MPVSLYVFLVGVAIVMAGSAFGAIHYPTERRCRTCGREPRRPLHLDAIVIAGLFLAFLAVCLVARGL